MCARVTTARLAALTMIALHKLEERGFIVAEWGVTEHNRRAKFYKLTPAGRAALRSETTVWKQYVDAVHKVLEPT